MANEKRLIDANALEEAITTDYWEHFSLCHDTDQDALLDMVCDDIGNAHTIDAVEVVRCSKCRYADPYERMDGKTGYHCLYRHNSFTYGQRLDRVFNPVKEADDFCSYGERRCGDGEKERT